MALRWLTNIRLNGQNVLLRTYEDYPAFDYYFESDVRYARLHIAGFTRFGNVVQEGDMIIDTNDGRNYTFELNNEDTITWTVTETGRKQFFYHNEDWTKGTDYSRTAFKERAPLSICVDDDNEIAFIMLTAKQYNDTSTNYYVELCSENYPSWGSPQHRMYVGVMSEEPTPPGPTPGDPDTFTFYNFSKKINSTHQPTTGFRIDGYFRHPFSLLSPVIRIEQFNNIFPYNYCSWVDPSVNMTRYYWIREKTWFPNNIVELVLEEDPLATFKPQIAGSEFFVTRCGYRYNPLITDNTYPALNGYDIGFGTFTPLDPLNGFYVVAFAMKNKETGTPPADYPRFAVIGGIQYFAFSPEDLNSLLSWINEDAVTGDWADYNPVEHIISIKYVPIEVERVQRSSTTVPIFEHNSGGSVKNHITDSHYQYIIPSDNRVGYVESIAFPNHPDFDLDGGDMSYLNYPPYTELKLKAGPFGEIELSKNMIDKDDTRQFDIHVDIDLISGLSRLQIFSNTNIVYSTEDYSCCIDIAITAERFNKYSDILRRDINRDLGMMGSGVTAGIGAVSMGAGIALNSAGSILNGGSMVANAITTGVATLANNKIDSYLATIPESSTKGTNGTWMKIRENWRLSWTFRRISGNARSKIGQPLFALATIGTLSGIVVCSGASFESDKATLIEITMINDFLNNGFFME